MKIMNETLSLMTQGYNDMHDITQDIVQKLAEFEISNGLVTIFVPGSTGGLTTIEYEPGLEQDFAELMDRIAPHGVGYHHDARWGDGNGFSHVRASLLGPSLSIPVADGRMTLGTWQQIVFIDFDNRSRSRTLMLQFMGE
jgi:secondary thiamine-phosphate synthase enzyme